MTKTCRGCCLFALRSATVCEERETERKGVNGCCSLPTGDAGLRRAFADMILLRLLQLIHLQPSVSSDGAECLFPGLCLIRFTCGHTHKAPRSAPRTVRSSLSYVRTRLLAKVDPIGHQALRRGRPAPWEIHPRRVAPVPGPAERPARAVCHACDAKRAERRVEPPHALARIVARGCLVAPARDDRVSQRAAQRRGGARRSEGLVERAERGVLLAPPHDPRDRRERLVSKRRPKRQDLHPAPPELSRGVQTIPRRTERLVRRSGAGALGSKAHLP